MTLEIGKTFVNGNGVKAEVVSFRNGRVLYKIIRDKIETFYDTLISSFNNMITANGYFEESFLKSLIK